MEIEQLVALTYFFLGILAAFLSNFFSSNLVLATILPLVIYVVSLILLVKFIRKKKGIKMLILSGFFTFALIWLVFWIFLYNL